MFSDHLGPASENPGFCNDAAATLKLAHLGTPRFLSDAAASHTNEAPAGSWDTLRLPNCKCIRFPTSLVANDVMTSMLCSRRHPALFANCDVLLMLCNHCVVIDILLFMSYSHLFGHGAPTNCFRFAIPAEALGAQWLRGRAAHRLRIVTFEN